MYYIRVDFGSKSGLGHLNRSISLIKYLKIKNYKIIVDNPLDEFLNKINKNRIINLYSKGEKCLNETDDAKKFIKKIANNKKSIVIKDSYRFGYKWEKIVSKFANKIIIIDDFINKKHFADFYINHNPKFLKPNTVELDILKKNNKPNCNFLLGPNFSLFNSTCVKKKSFRSDFVFYNGGSGNLLIYERVIRELLKLKKNAKVIIILGPYSKNFTTLKKKFKSYKKIFICDKPTNIIDYLKDTRVFISSAGTSMFESSFLKIPTLLFKMNSNQNLSNLDYENIDHYFSLEKKDLKSTHKIARLIFLMFQNEGKIKKLMNSSKINFFRIKKNYKKFLKNKI
jgi:UDP-2,4-diacetamido-2,4,6-trideoxy-beta-L-altropyranose hydrolase